MGSRRVVLVGAGHAHLGIVAQAAEFARRGVDLVVVGPEDFHYSGLATGVLGGAYAPVDDVVDIARLASRGGAHFVRDVVVAVDVERRCVHLAGGTRIAWDACSLDVGSRVAVDAIPGGAEHAVAVKPIANLLRLRETLTARAGAARTVRVVVAGGGASGCEVALNVAALGRRLRRRFRVTLVGREPRAISGLPRGAGRAVTRTLRRAGIQVVTDGVAEVRPDGVLLDGGGGIASDVVVLATGLVPPPLARASGLAVDERGALEVDATLRARDVPAVHGGGDAVRVAGQALPQIGVHAVREAPVLLHNLLAALDDRPPRTYVPQPRALLILNLGDGTGLATRGGLWWRGRLAWWLKDAIDRRWMAGWRAAGG